MHPYAKQNSPQGAATRDTWPSWRALIKYLIVAVCSALVTFLTSSCTAGLVIGKNQRQQQENNISTRIDSSHFVPTISIR